MDCALWLNRRKVLSASEISENLDVASLRGYFTAGSLLDWLRAHGGEAYAEKLSEISPNDERLNEKLAEIFGGEPLPVKQFGTGAPTPPVTAQSPSSFNLPSSYNIPSSGIVTSFYGAFGSGYGAVGYGSGISFIGYGFAGSGLGGSYAYLASLASSYSFGALYESIFGSGSFYSGSFGGFGTFRFSEWEWEWEWLLGLFSGEFGSFSVTSFGSGSLWSRELLFALLSGGLFGSRSIGSFSFGSFRINLSALLGSFRGFGAGSYRGFGSYRGSFAAQQIQLPRNLPFMDEYDLIMLETLIKCPLNGFGYGIHNI